jgi:hypothetical protein
MMNVDKIIEQIRGFMYLGDVISKFKADITKKIKQ